MILRRGACGLSEVLAVLVLAACGGNSTAASNHVATAVIGPAGGTIPVTAADDSVLAGTSITIPPNALTADTTISIGPSDVIVAPKGTTAAGPVIDFEPSGTVFAKPVTITIPVTATSSLYIEAVEADGSAKQISVTSVTDGLATFQVGGFTSFGGWTGESSVDGGVGCGGDADCASGTACVDGVCTATGSDAGVGCGGDADCASGTTCVDGVCTSSGLDAGVNPTDAASGQDAAPCAAGDVACGGACVDIQSDPNNCGACSTACASGETCSAGVCTG